MHSSKFGLFDMMDFFNPGRLYRSFLIKIIFSRLERVNMKRLRDHIKIVGTLVTVGGAMIITLVTGPVIGFPWTKNMPESKTTEDITSKLQPIKGAVMISIGCICWSLFYILQVCSVLSLLNFPNV